MYNVSGETGIGKSTLCDSLFNTTFDSAPETHKEAGVRLKAHTYELQESNVNLKLTLVDTVSEPANQITASGHVTSVLTSDWLLGGLRGPDQQGGQL